jgi:hypothetical protein
MMHIKTAKFWIGIILTVVLGISMAQAAATYYNDYNTYMYYKKGNNYIGAMRGIAKAGKNYGSRPTGEDVYYCANARGNCCSNVHDDAIEIYVCRDPGCDFGEFRYLDSRGNTLGTAQHGSDTEKGPGDARMGEGTRFKTC